MRRVGEPFIYHVLSVDYYLTLPQNFSTILNSIGGNALPLPFFSRGVVERSLENKLLKMKYQVEEQEKVMLHRKSEERMHDHSKYKVAGGVDVAACGCSIRLQLIGLEVSKNPLPLDTRSLTSRLLQFTCRFLWLPIY